MPRVVILHLPYYIHFSSTKFSNPPCLRKFQKRLDATPPESMSSKRDIVVRYIGQSKNEKYYTKEIWIKNGRFYSNENPSAGAKISSALSWVRKSGSETFARKQIQQSTWNWTDYWSATTTKVFPKKIPTSHFSMFTQSAQFQITTDWSNKRS